jgi:hypothetical protein
MFENVCILKIFKKGASITQNYFSQKTKWGIKNERSMPFPNSLILGPKTVIGKARWKKVKNPNNSKFT